MSGKLLIGKVLLLLVMLLALVGGPALLGCTGVNTIPRGWSGGVIADDTIFLGSMEGKLVAIDVSSQERRWPDVPFEASKKATGFGCAPDAGGVAIYGSPSLTEELVYIAAYHGKLYAINSETGALRWVYPREGELEPIVGGPVSVLGKVYIGSSDGKLYALDAATGDKGWEFETGGKIWSTPSVNGDTVYIGSFDKKLYALDTVDGRKKWEFATEGAIVATPLVYDDTVYIGSFDRYLYALSEADGSLRWKFQAENWFWGRPLADGGVIYTASVDGRVYAFNAGNGDKIAEFNLGSPVSSSPVLSEGSVMVASQAGRIYAVNSGQQKKQLVDLEEEIYASLAASGGVVYVHTDKDVLYAVDTRSGAIRWSLSLESE
ncbi:MAG: PQQ-binding-like beta-propeller repeat protein [Dehalococcoidales bacterium]|nr:PQQ-binding-like beta-propeller repeat protein [Dehalococcoidales bacterium]MDP6222209.1 PQQ-binding-like beta-propeller repeat protein [Dehalococcoidales bacterium]